MAIDHELEKGAATSVLSDLVLHHVGVACTDLNYESQSFALLGYRQVGADFHDPIQGVVGRFLEGPQPRIELLAEAPGSRVLTPWIKAGVKIYHFAYETPSLDDSLTKLVESGGYLVRAPEPAVAFGGRRVAFGLLTNRMLVELIESSEPSNQTPASRSLHQSITSG